MFDLSGINSKQLEAAAAALTAIDAIPEAIELLRYFDYDDGDAGAAAGRARMLRGGAIFRRLFRLPMPDAPGLVFFGAEADPSSLGPHNAGLAIGGFAGSGLDARRAFEACVGEGIEYLSQFSQPDDPIEYGMIDVLRSRLDSGTYGFLQQVFQVCGVPADRTISWIPVRRCADGETCWFPADLCLRRAAPDFVPPLKLSTGCAAGATRKDATLRAMLELIERDAMALWWRGGRRGRQIASNSEGGHEAASLLIQLRGGRHDRQTSLLDITTDLGIPVVVAFSSQPDGYGCALGMAAQTTQAAAVRSAIFEMCQSELSLHVIAAKRCELGKAALNKSDLRQLARAETLNARVCPLLQPSNEAAVPPPVFTDDDMETIVRLLAERGIVAYSIDLTRPQFEVPVVRVIAPRLQLEPCKIIGERLAKAITDTGGGAPYSAGIALL